MQVRGMMGMSIYCCVNVEGSVICHRFIMRLLTTPMSTCHIHNYTTSPRDFRSRCGAWCTSS